MTSTIFLYALLASIAPALLWLWFWIREDRRCPEPKGLVGLSFLAGMIAVPLVIPFQNSASMIFTGGALITMWAAIEELFKIGAAYLIALRTKEMNEPIDAVIYLITVALGFAAFENTLFLLDPLMSGLAVEATLTGNFRFIGATLLHTLSSATVGIAIALAFYRKSIERYMALGVGIILAIALHALFNFFILRSNGEDLLTVFLFVWIGIVIVILLFERIKAIKNPRSITYG
jgi:RsiW-degrading membrane proteinase PrsW (M82 family)